MFQLVWTKVVDLDLGKLKTVSVDLMQWVKKFLKTQNSTH